MLAAGDLTERITLQQRDTTAQNGLGENTAAWVDVVTVYAKAEPIRGREYFAAAQMQATTDVRFTIRYRAGVLQTMRVLWRGEPHDIQDVINPLGRRESLELMTVKGQRDGR